jgi:hypothetical protein
LHWRWSSYIIIYDVLKKEKQRKKRTAYHRLMVGLSTCDIIMSAGLISSTWPMPKDTPNVWGALGTTRSCVAIGFLEQAGVSAVLYSGSLSIYYLLRIQNVWKESQIVKYEPFVHLLPIVFGLGTMIAGLVLDLFNSGIFDCWIAPFAQG